MKPAAGDQEDYTDGRQQWEWESRYPPNARHELRREAVILTLFLLITICLAGITLGLDQEPLQQHIFGLEVWINYRILAIFFTGCLGGVTFSIKWFVHATAKGMWHQDRVYWRFLVPILGGVYACVIMSFWTVGWLPGQLTTQSDTIVTVASLAFLVGYFSDGVSGLLSNVANAVFGTVQKKK